MIRKRKFKSILFTLLGLSIGASGSQYAAGASYGPLVGGSVTLENGDQVVSTTSYGIDSSSAGSGVQVHGSAEITVTNSGSQSKGIYLDNGANNDFGSGTTVTVTNTSGTSPGGSTGILIENKLNEGTELVADHLKVSVLNDKQAIGILGTGNGKINIGLASEIKVTSIGANQIATGVSLGTKDRFAMSQGKIDVQLSTGNATGIVTSSQSEVNLGKGTEIIATTGSGSGKGIIGNTDSVITADQLKLTVSGSSASGISNTTNSTIHLGNDSQISVTALGYGTGIELKNGSKLDANRLAIQMNLNGSSSGGYGIRMDGGTANFGKGSSVSVVGNQGAGILAMGSTASLIADEMMVSTNGNSATGVNVQNGAQINLGSGSRISTAGTNSHAVWSVGSDALFTAEKATLLTKEIGSTGLTAQSGGNASIGSGSHVSSIQAGGLVAYSTNASQKSNIDFWGSESDRNTIFSGGSYGASAQFIGASVNLKNTDILVDRSGLTTLGLWALGGGTIKGENITIDASATGARGVYTMTDGKIYLSGETQVVVAEGGMALATQYNEGQNSGMISTTGKMLLHGDILARGNGIIELKTSSGSQIKGGSTVEQTTGAQLSMNMSGTHWEMTRDSQVTNLTLNNSQVDFISPQSGEGKSTLVYSKLDLVNLDGSDGLFRMRTDLENLQGDLISISGTSAGLHKLLVNNQGGANVDPTQELILVETTDGNAAFSLQNQLEVGGYLYGLKKTGTDWSLYSTGRATSSVAGVMNVFSGGYLLNYAESQTLLQRMGDLRQGNDHGNIWARSFGGEFTSRGDSFLKGYQMNYHGFQVGADKKINRKEKLGDLYIGGFFGYSKGTLDYGTGNGSIDSKTLGAYGTFKAPSGFYSDLTVKYSWLKNDFIALDSAGSRVTGESMKTTGLTGSLEIGKKFHRNRDADQGWYLEPQAQLSIGHQSGGTFRASNGLRVEIEGYHSILGRLGSNLGYEIKRGKNPVNGYIKIQRVHEFDGNVDYQLNGHKESASYGGSWWVWGAGLTAQIKEKHNLYFDIERASGGQFNQPWKMSGGYRFTW